jgi:hypothetical protein
MTNGDSLHWRPISTAPPGRTILVYSLRWGATVATYDAEAGAWTAHMNGHGEMNGLDRALITHWMPMPGVPAELTGARSAWLSLAA